MKFFKTEDFDSAWYPSDPQVMDLTMAISICKLANAKLELELGNEYAIVNHFKAENERLLASLESINPYDIICIAEKHVISVVGGGAIDFDSCQDAIQTYLNAAKANKP